MKNFCAGSVTIFFVSGKIELAFTFPIIKYRRLRIKLDFSCALTMYIILRDFVTKNLHFFIFIRLDEKGLDRAPRQKTFRAIVDRSFRVTNFVFNVLDRST